MERNKEGSSKSGVRGILVLLLLKPLIMLIVILLIVLLILLLIGLIVWLILQPISWIKDAFSLNNTETLYIAKAQSKYNTVSYMPFVNNADYGKDFSAVTYASMDGTRTIYYFSQQDIRWADEIYGDGTDSIKEYACGAASLAMIASSITEEEVNVKEMATWLYDNGYHVPGNGTAQAAMNGAASNWNIKVSSYDPKDVEEIKAAFSSGDLFIVLMGAGDFTNYGHYIVVRGYNEKTDSVLVLDPYDSSKNDREWEIYRFLSQTKSVNEYGAPIWRFSWKSSADEKKDEKLDKYYVDD